MLIHNLDWYENAGNIEALLKSLAPFKDRIATFKTVSMTSGPYDTVVECLWYESGVVFVYSFNEDCYEPTFNGYDLRKYFKDFTNPTREEYEMFQMVTGTDYWVYRLLNEE